MEYLTLNTGDKAPILGFGTYLIDPADTKMAVYEAIKAGYRSIDTAQDYENEFEVGQGIKKAINEGIVQRKDLFITTKVDTDGYNLGKKGIEQSIKRLGVEYIDMMILHWPREDDIGSYKALEDYYYANKIRNIGLSNFNISQTKNLLENIEVKPVVDQIETNLYLQQEKMHKFLIKNGIVHESWSPLAQGAKVLNNNRILKKLGAKYDKTGVQILLRYLVQNKIMTIPRSINPDHIAQNFDIFNFKLNSQELKQINKLDKHRSETGWPTWMQIDA